MNNSNNNTFTNVITGDFSVESIIYPTYNYVSDCFWYFAILYYSHPKHFVLLTTFFLNNDFAFSIWDSELIIGNFGIIFKLIFLKIII